jgi:hypothetical protein
MASRLQSRQRLVGLGALSLLVALAASGMGPELASGASAASADPVESTTTLPTSPEDVNPAPLVTINTMAKENSHQGVLIDPHRNLELPACPQNVTSGPNMSCFYADPSPDSWVQLVVLNRETLSFISNTDLQCPEATEKRFEDKFNYLGNPCNKLLSSTIGALNSGDLVVAVNQPGTPNVQPPIGLDAVLGSIGGNSGIGANPAWSDASNGSNPKTQIDPVRGTFSAIGVPGLARDQGISNTSMNFKDSGSGALNAPVTIDNSLLYTPTDTAAALSGTNSNLMPLAKVLFEPASLWPEQAQAEQAQADKAKADTEAAKAEAEEQATQAAERTAALSALGHAAALGADPRAAYYTEGLNFDWDPALYAIRNAQFSALDPPASGFDKTQFKWAKDELEKEIIDVKAVDSYILKLASAYTNAKGALWSTFGEVTTYVNNSVENTNEERVAANVRDVLGAILTIGSAIPGLGVAPSIVSAAYTVAVYFATHGEQSTAQPFDVTAAHLGVQLTSRLDAAETEMELSWRDILVADYQKMRTVALCSPLAPTRACPDPAQGWHLTSFDVQKVKKTLELALERTLYLSLVPAKYHILVNIYNDTAHDSYPFHPEYKVTAAMVRGDPSLFRCVGFGTPFPKGTGTYQRSDSDEVYVLTNDPPGLDAFKSASAVLFARMFSPPNGNGDWSKTVNTGGVGINEADFFNSNYISTKKSVTFVAKFPARGFTCSLHYPGR